MVGTTLDFLKNLITTVPVLDFCDVSQPVKLSVDASLQGLGTVFMQNERSLAYASLTDCENDILNMDSGVADPP